jgi:hypothetical protein
MYVGKVAGENLAARPGRLSKESSSPGILNNTGAWGSNKVTCRRYVLLKTGSLFATMYIVFRKATR